MKTVTHSISPLRIALLLAFVIALPAVQAATVSRSGLLVVSSATAGLGSAFEVGDIFTYTLSYNDAITDADSDPGYGEFTGALSSFTILAQTSRSGIWQPTASMGSGNVYAEDGAPQTWYFDVTPDMGFGPQVSGYSAVMFAMGFGGLPANGDRGGGQSLGLVTGNLLDFVSPTNSNYAELSFEAGLDSQLVTFELTSFHAPEPSRSMLLLGALSFTIFSRKRR